MAGGIKGIVVKIGGDTTELGKALTDAQKQSNSLQRELKGVNTLLKNEKGIKNTELLKQKQELLTKSITETKAKLSALQEIQKKADNGEIEMTEAEYRNLQREIAATKQKLEKLNQEQKEFGSVGAQTIKEYGSQVEAAGKKVEDLGKKLKPLSAASGALIAGSLASFNELDDGLDIVTVKTGATGDTLKGLQENAKNLATEIPTDFETAGSAVGEVNTKFGLTGKACEELSGQFIKFAQLNNTDVSTSVDNVSKGLQAFGLDSSHAGELLDALNATGQKTGVSVDDLSKGLYQNAAALQEMGMSAEQSVAFLGQVEMSGLDTSTAMMGLKTAMKNSAAEGKTMSQAMGDFQNVMNSNASETEKLQAAYDLFGAKSGAAIYNACKNGKLNLKDFAGSVDDMGGSVSKTFDETLDPIDQFKTTLNQLKITGAELGAAIGQVLGPILQSLAEKLKTFAAWFQKLGPGAQRAIAIALMITAALAPVLMFVGKLIQSVGSIMKLLPMLAGPAGIVIGIIAAVIAIGVLLYKNWDTIKEKAAALKAHLVGIWNAIKGSIETVVNGIKTVVTTVFGAVASFVTTCWNGIKTVTQTAWNLIKTFVVNPITSAKNLVVSLVNGIKSGITSGWNAIKSVTSSVWNAIKSLIVNPVQSAWNTISGIVSKIKNAFNFHWSLPPLKIPHITISGGKAPFGIAGKGSLPKFNIKWYAKAMDNAMLFTQPTILPTMDGYKGFGDAGAELVIGNNTLMSMIQKAMASRDGSGAVVAKLDAIEKRMDNLEVVMDSGEVVGSIRDKMDTALNGKMIRTARGW